MAKTTKMVQCNFTRAGTDGATINTVAWVEKKPKLAVGASVTFKDTDEVWRVESIGAEREAADIEALQDAQRALADKLSLH